MNLAVISDIHDNIWNLRAAMHWLISRQGDEAIQALICCGDLCSPFVMNLLITYCTQDRMVPIHLVFGNNDGDTSRITAQAKERPFVHIHNEFAELVVRGSNLFPRATIKDDQGRDVYFESTGTHERIAVQHFDSIARPIAVGGKYGLVCFGHNHQYEATIYGDTLALNPGTLMGYNPLAQGDVKDVAPTFAICVPETQEVRFYQVTQPWATPDSPGHVAPFSLHPAG